MDTVPLIRDAWTVTWRYRFLWILGLLAGGGSVMTGSGGGGGARSEHQYRSVPAELSWLSPAMSAAGMGLSAWAVANIGLLVALALVASGVVLALIVTSFIAKGGMVRATADLATGRTSTLALAAAGALVFASVGLSTPFFAYAGLGGLLLLVGVLTLRFRRAP